MTVVAYIIASLVKAYRLKKEAKKPKPYLTPEI